MRKNSPGDPTGFCTWTRGDTPEIEVGERLFDRLLGKAFSRLNGERISAFEFDATWVEGWDDYERNYEDDDGPNQANLALAEEVDRLLGHESS